MLGYGAGGMAYGFKHEVVPPLVGGTVGALQVTATNLADLQGTLGTPFVPQVWATNGELVNTLTGGVALGAAAAGSVGKGRYLSTHEGARNATLGYGIVALVAGWVVPLFIRVAQGKAFRASGRMGGGRFAYLPSPAPMAQGAAVYGSGLTSQANAQVLRRLFASPY